MVAKVYDVVLCGYYGFGNLGDELICRALIEMALKAGMSKSRLCVLSANPKETSEKFGVAAVDRWNLFEVFRALRQSRSLLLGGGGLFQDSTSLRSSLYYWGVVFLARMAGVRPWAFGQSVGPFRSKLAAKLARNALKHCSPRCVRDDNSAALLSSWGLEFFLAPDAVFALSFKETEKASDGDVLVFNVRPLPRQEGGVKLLVREAERFAKMQRYKLRAVCMAEEDLKELKASGVSPDCEVFLLKGASDVEPAFEGAAKAAGMRLHFCLLALMKGIPLVAFPYDPKVKSFALTWNIPIWERGERFDSLFSEARQAEGQKVAEAREALRKSFDSALKIALGDEEHWNVNRS